MTIKTNIYKNDGQWCYATWADGEFDDSSALDVADDATVSEAEAAARAMYPGREVEVSRIDVRK